MSGKRQKTQYSLALEPTDRGKAPGGGCEGAEPLVAETAPESPAWTEQLMEKACDRENLETAWKRACDALPGVNLSLTIERQVIGVFGDENISHRHLGRQSALNQSCRRGRLHHDLLAGPTGIFWPAHDQHAQLRRDDVQSFAAILADPMQQAAAAGTAVIFDVDHHLDARQMWRKRSPVHAAPGGTMRPFGWGGGFFSSLTARHHLLDVFEPKQKLIFRQCLRTSAEAMAPQFLDDLLQPFGASTLGQQHRLQRAGIVRKRIGQIHESN